LPDRASSQRRSGPLVCVAGRLPLLDLAKHPVEAWIGSRDRNPEALEFGDEVRLAGLLRHQHMAAVADDGGIDVLVGPRVLEDGRRVDASLGGERRGADIGA
jgi:hypothetical protein